MGFTLKSLEFLQGVEPFRIDENHENEGASEEEEVLISAETDAGMSLMLGQCVLLETLI